MNLPLRQPVGENKIQTALGKKSVRRFKPDAQKVFWSTGYFLAFTAFFTGAFFATTFLATAFLAGAAAFLQHSFLAGAAAFLQHISKNTDISVT